MKNLNTQDTKLIKNTMRQIFRRSRVFNDFLKRKVERKVGRRNVYKCTQCKDLYARPSIEVNHIVPLKDAKDIYQWMCWLFAEENLEIVCKDCHLDVTQEQRRKNDRKGNKDLG